MTSRSGLEDGSDRDLRERDRQVRRWDARDQEEYEADLAARLMSWDPVQRREAIEEMDAEGEDLAPVLEFAAQDEDPDVRAAAVAQLGDAQSFAALRGVVRALDDPDPRVVLQAIESLEETGDASFLAELARLRDHPDPQVRAREADASDYLAD
jgi:HEAT repeat protein